MVYRVQYCFENKLFKIWYLFFLHNLIILAIEFFLYLYSESILFVVDFIITYIYFKYKNIYRELIDNWFKSQLSIGFA